jgi:CMP-N-acetylneuraminic acid synthetase
LPGKNIKKLLGKPLIAYSIEHARGSKYIDRTIISTDSEKIASVCRKLGCEVPFLRPKHLATDTSSTVDALLHAIEWMETKEKYDFDILVLLHVTTPLRSPKDIDNSIELLFKKCTDNVFSVTPAHKNPYFNMVEVKKSGRVALIKKGSFTSRQSAPSVFDMNSSIYVWWKDVLKSKKSLFPGNTGIYLMPKERSVDIDDYLDFKMAQMLLKR